MIDIILTRKKFLTNNANPYEILTNPTGPGQTNQVNEGRSFLITFIFSWFSDQKMIFSDLWKYAFSSAKVAKFLVMNKISFGKRPTE